MIETEHGFKRYEGVEDFKENFNYEDFYDIYGDRGGHIYWLDPFVYFFLTHNDIEIKAIDSDGAYSGNLYNELPSRRKVEGRFNTRIPDGIIEVNGEEIVFELKSNINDLKSRLKLQLYEYDYAGYRTAIGLSHHCTVNADHTKLGAICEEFDSLLLMSKKDNGIMIDYPRSYTE